MILEKRNIDIEKMNRIAEILKVISHPIRLEILEILEHEEPLAVCDIMERVSSDVEQSALSHNLIKLKDKGILLSEKKGKNILYRLKDRQILKIFDCMGGCNAIL